ncbi:variable surface protein [Plasmodium gonderi]|uniref:Variable surface protein n=1 Tax=Plasmodium gonderi TaxID=77519 RepID=A0A1Y1JV62_PLAGO|nr:variable surface protein [Plasmodium gonderi]GAW84283.1 variable surface protein [Plasmodium gonderi]
MSSDVSDKTYCTLKDYNDFEKIIEDTRNVADNKSEVDEFLRSKSIIIDNTDKTMFYDVCKRINEYLKYFKANDSCNNSKCCSFINYWLNKDPRIRFHAQKEGVIKNLKDYIKYNNSGYIYDICLPKINNMKIELFEKIQNLYDMYDLYENFLESIKYSMGKSYTCKYLNDLIDKYNKIMETDIGENDNFILNELYIIRCLIEDKLLGPNKFCKENLHTISDNIKSIPYTKKCNVHKEREHIQGDFLNFEANFSTHATSYNSIMKSIIVTLSVIIVIGVIFLYLCNVNKNSIHNLKLCVFCFLNIFKKLVHQIYILKNSLNYLSYISLQVSGRIGFYCKIKIRMYNNMCIKKKIIKKIYFFFNTIFKYI